MHPHIPNAIKLVTDMLLLPGNVNLTRSDTMKTLQILTILSILALPFFSLAQTGGRVTATLQDSGGTKVMHVKDNGQSTPATKPAQTPAKQPKQPTKPKDKTQAVKTH